MYIEKLELLPHENDIQKIHALLMDASERIKILERIFISIEHMENNYRNIGYTITRLSQDYNEKMISLDTQDKLLKEDIDCLEKEIRDFDKKIKDIPNKEDLHKVAMGLNSVRVEYTFINKSINKLRNDIEDLKMPIKYKLEKKIVKKGFPTTAKGYQTSHEKADKVEKKADPKAYKAMKKVDNKLGKNELAGKNLKSGKILISKKVPKKDRENVYLHEKVENKNLLKKKKK